MDVLRQSYAYVLDRSVQSEPRHQHYQVRLTRFLANQGIAVTCEENFVDVQFRVDLVSFIGEVKVAFRMSVQEAFRAALGQILEYAHLLFPAPPSMVIFLDRMLDQRRVDLAARLGVNVVVEHEEAFFVLRPTQGSPHPALQRLFAARTPV